jgi:hypothetical protein
MNNNKKKEKKINIKISRVFYLILLNDFYIIFCRGKKDKERMKKMKEEELIL